jgi:hypothetical protein
MKKFIQHRGIVKHTGGGRIVVCIEQQSACSACHARSACLASDKKEKLIEVKGESRQFAPGEEVMVVAQSSSGMQAVALAFAVPFVLVVAAVFIGARLSGGDDGIGGLAGLAVLAVYYALLYAFREKIGRRFSFSVAKLEAGSQLDTATY